MKLYIAGVISNGGTLPRGKQWANAQRFYDAEEHIKRLGHEPINPLHLHPVGEDTDWQAVMKDDIKVMMDCDGVYALRGWSEGKGSVIEVELAQDLGMRVFNEWEDLP